VTLINVINLPQVHPLDQQTLDSPMDIAQQIVEQQAEIGRSLGASVKTLVLKEPVQREILTFARTEHVDLIVQAAMSAWSPVGFSSVIE